jgi:mannose-1-phosphate guanylyltransferase
MVVLPADHVIGDEAAFRVMVQIGARLAGSGSHLVTLGVAPTRPETGYGHIQIGQQMGEIDGHPFYRVQAFIEKPDWPRAKTYTESGQYLWNSGMFIWSVETVLESLRRHLPDLHGGLMSIAATPGKQQRRQKIESVYRSMDSISIDYGVMEKADNVIVVPCHFGWNDVGTWASLGDIQQADAHGNVVLCPFVGLETTNSIIVAQQKLVATIGLDDLIIVDTPDALLICPRERAQAVKEIVERLHAEGLDAYS